MKRLILVVPLLVLFGCNDSDIVVQPDRVKCLPCDGRGPVMHLNPGDDHIVWVDDTCFYGEETDGVHDGACHQEGDN